MKNETRPTSGPWACHSGSVYKGGHGFYPRGDDLGTPIAHMDREAGNGTSPAERDANAHLIAASPEMYVALAGIVEMLRLSDDEWDGEQDQLALTGRVMLAEQVLAKARGEEVQS